MNVSIYNHQLCVLDPRLHTFARNGAFPTGKTHFTTSAPNVGSGPMRRLFRVFQPSKKVAGFTPCKGED